MLAVQGHRELVQFFLHLAFNTSTFLFDCLLFCCFFCCFFLGFSFSFCFLFRLNSGSFLGFCLSFCFCFSFLGCFFLLLLSLFCSCFCFLFNLNLRKLRRLWLFLLCWGSRSRGYNFFLLYSSSNLLLFLFG